jgi:hypothetical protein
MMHWPKPVFTNKCYNAGRLGAAKQASSLISDVTIAYFCGKINHLAIVTLRPQLAAKI